MFFLQGSEGGTQEVRVVNAWHQPEPTDTIPRTIAALMAFFCTAPSVTEVRCVLWAAADLGEHNCRAASAAGSGSAPTACTAWECHSGGAEPGSACGSR